MNINLNFDLEKLVSDIQNNIQDNMDVLCEQIVDDCNQYIPLDKGVLQNSVNVCSDQQGAKVSWNTPYARKLYYSPHLNLSKDKNPNAQAFWFETAKASHLGQWIDILKQNIL